MHLARLVVQLASRLQRHVGLAPRPGEVVEHQGFSTDGKLLFALLALILLGPYLPILALARIVGVDIADGQTDARLDNLALPLFALYFLVRSLISNRLIFPIHLIWYAAFLGWLGLMTLFWWSNMPDDFSDHTARGVGLLRSIDAYGRPAAMLLIAANVRITRRDFTLLVRLILGVGLLLGVIAAGQLLDLTDGPVNRFLFNNYDNNPENHFWSVLNQGRVAALMPQLSTLGMYVVLGSGLLAAQLMGARAVKSAVIFGLLSGGIFLAGILSGSKVFVGGTGLLAFGVILLFRSVCRDSLLKIMAGVIAISLVFFASSVIFPDRTNGFVGLAIPRPVVPSVIEPVVSSVIEPVDSIATGTVIEPVDSIATATGTVTVTGAGDSIAIGQGESEGHNFFDKLTPNAVYDRFFHRFYIVYLASRFDTTDGKIFRTGATDIATEYPATGLGLNVVNRTTDSMALGIFIMGGAIGSFLYLGALAAMGIGLLRIAKHAADPESAGMAKMLLTLTVIFLVMSIGFHTFIQDRAGDAYWLLAGLMVGPLASIAPSRSMTRNDNS